MADVLVKSLEAPVTDLVDSTATAARLGDARWRALLSAHFEAVCGELERFGGREVKTKGLAGKWRLAALVDAVPAST